MQQSQAGKTSQPDVEGTAHALVGSLRAIVETTSPQPPSPTQLANQLGLSRVTVSKLLGSLDQSTLFDTLERIPGPDSLRDFVRSTARINTSSELINSALSSIDRFETLIRDHFGTRDALHAAIGSQSTALRSRIDMAARGDVFKGLRQVLGVEADTWLTAMIFVPHATDPEWASVTTIHGAIGMRRLRPDAEVYFTFGPPYHEADAEPQLSKSPVSLQEFYTNEPANLEVEMTGGQLRHRLVGDRLGKDARADMLAVSHAVRASRRYAAPGSKLRGVSVFVDTPVRMLVADAIVHRDIFPEREPELFVYNPGARGPANPNDPSRNADRVLTPEPVVHVPRSSERFEVDEVPNYRNMIESVSRQIGCVMSDFRVHRLRLAYPVPCFQHVIAFEAPDGK
ncbi:MAG: hypothetical protein U0640_00250 [Phycisphaerales bacterium]